MGNLFSQPETSLTKAMSPQDSHQKPEPSLMVKLGDGITLELVHIPKGTFPMGAPDSENNSWDWERPIHEVTLPEFWMGKYPVTQIQYQAVMGSNPSYFKGYDLPVENVSWDNAVSFCSRASKQAAMPMRLPSEAEWEYACRARTTTRYYFGDTISREQANFKTDYTTPSGKYPANAFGLYDMHGNVWEWCQDYWHDTYQAAPADGSAWLGPDGSARLLRGGSWISEPNCCRSAYRNYNAPDSRTYNYGFRVVCLPKLR